MGQLVEFSGLMTPAYKLETANAACSRDFNVYAELIEKGPRAGKLRKRGIPGKKRFATLGDAPMRGMLRIDSGNRLFAVAGSTVYEVFGDGTSVAQVGGVAASSRPALMETNGFQIAIASGGQAYLVEGGLPAGTVKPITFTDGTPVRAATIAFLGQYFVAALINSKQVVISGLAPDGGLWDAADTAIKEGYSDNIARVFADNQTLWAFGFDTAEPWSVTGDVFPFTPIPGAVLKYGCTAPYSVAGALGKRFWLFKDSIYGAYGLNPERVSDCGVETAIKSYGDVSDAEAYCYTTVGHLFYVISFPSVRRTWVLDANPKIMAWHERGYWENGQQGQYRGRVYANAFGKDLVGDPQTGDIYELDDNTFTDAGGAPLRRQIVSPYWSDGFRNIRHNQLLVDVDTGVGLAGEPGQPGVDPQLIMRYADDRGKNWSSERQATLGEIGEDYTRVIFNQNGSSRIGKVYELVCTDPVRFAINGAWLNLGAPEQGR